MAKPSSNPPSKRTQPSTPNTGALERVSLRNDFYRDRFRMLVTAVPVLAVALLVSMGLNAVQFSQKPKNHYFAIDADGRLIPIKSLSEPYVTEGRLLTWVSETVTRAYRMDAQNYKAQVMEMSDDFTPEGFAEYTESLQSSGTIEFLTKNLLISSATPTGAPLIVERNLTQSGAYYWRIQIPMLVEYKSGLKAASKKRIVEVIVVRRHTVESKQGIGISKFFAKDLT